MDKLIGAVLGLALALGIVALYVFLVATFFTVAAPKLAIAPAVFISLMAPCLHLGWGLRTIWTSPGRSKLWPPSGLLGWISTTARVLSALCACALCLSIAPDLVALMLQLLDYEACRSELSRALNDLVTAALAPQRYLLEEFVLPWSALWSYPGLTLTCLKAALIAPLALFARGLGAAVPDSQEPAIRQYFFDQAQRDLAAVGSGVFPPLQRVVEVLVEQIRRSMLADDRVLFLWPLAITLATALYLSAVFGACALAVLLLMHSLTVWGIQSVFQLLALTLRWVERSRAWVRSRFVKCPHPGCHEPVRHPLYACASCGVLHPHLEPGPCGLLRRICQCGASLPTLRVLGKSSLRSACPKCKGDLLDQLFGANIHVPLYGEQNSGKTMLRATVAWQLLRGRLPYLEAKLIGSRSRDDYAVWSADLERGQFLDKTTERLASAFLLQLQRGRGLPVSLYLYDAAGETLTDRTGDLDSHRFIRYLDGLILVIDPHSLEAVRHEALDDSHNPLQRPEDLLSSVTAQIRAQTGHPSDRPIPTRLAVVFSKLDEAPVQRTFGLQPLESALPPPWRSSETPRSDQMETWLERHQPAFHAACLQNFDRARFFAVSTCGPDQRAGQAFSPRGVTDPLVWILDRHPLIRRPRLGTVTLRLAETLTVAAVVLALLAPASLFVAASAYAYVDAFRARTTERAETRRVQRVQDLVQGADDARQRGAWGEALARAQEAVHLGDHLEAGQRACVEVRFAWLRDCQQRERRASLSRWDEVLDAYEALSAAFPGDPEITRASYAARVRRIQALLEDPNPSRATEPFLEARQFVENLGPDGPPELASHLEGLHDRYLEALEASLTRLAQSNDFSSALEALERARPGLKPELERRLRLDVLRGATRYALGARRWEEAEQALEQLLRDAPNESARWSAEVWDHVRSLRQSNATSAARGLLEVVQRQFPSPRRVQRERRLLDGIDHEAAGRWLEAIASYRPLTSSGPGAEEAQRGLQRAVAAWLTRVEQRRRGRDWGDLLNDAEALLEVLPEQPDAVAWRDHATAQLHLERGRRHLQLNAWEETVEQARACGSLLAGNPATPDAEALSTQAQRLLQDVEVALLQKGLSAQLDGDPEEGDRCFVLGETLLPERAARFRSLRRALWREAATAAREQRAWELAANAYGHLLEVVEDAERGEVRFALETTRARALYSTGRGPDAVAHLEQALSLRPDHSGVALALNLARRTRGMVFVRGRVEGALAVGDLYVSRREVTNAEYWTFVEETGYHPEDARFFLHHLRRGLSAPEEPVRWVSAKDAEAYAEWAGQRLPTETEWEHAAVWDPAEERQRRYPWGESFEPARVGSLRDRSEWSRADFQRTASPSGVWDCAGGVMEWTSDPYRGAEDAHPLQAQPFRAVRGGSSVVPTERSCELSQRRAYRETYRAPDLGVRTVQSADLRMLERDH